MSNVYIITPVLNEEPNLETLILGWKNIVLEHANYNFHFILVDDGSTDNTANVAKELAKNLNFNVITHPKNMGPGYAFGSGFEFISKLLTKEDIVITLEGDNTSKLLIIKYMLGRIERENVDVVLASPHSYGGGFSETTFIRVMLSQIASALTKLLLNIRGINTFSSFFRAYKANVILELQSKYGARIIETKGFECMVELLLKIVLNKYSVSEIPMRLDTSLRKGKSKMRIMKTSIAYFKLFVISKKWKS